MEGNSRDGHLMSSEEDKPPPFLPSAYLQALGNLVAYWAYLESATEVVIWALLGVNRPAGAAITTNLNQASRLNVLKILTGQMVQDADGTLKGVLDRVEAARTKRNIFIHSLGKHQPTEEADAISILKVAARGKLTQQTLNTSLSDI